MADYGLFIGWGNIVRGRELKGLEVFNEALQFWAGHLQKGNIESFEPVLLNPHGGELAGFLLIKGDAAKLDQIKRSDEYQAINTRALQVVDNLGFVDCMLGAQLQRQLAEFQSRTADIIGVPAMATRG
jgi:hypothetical protein